MTSRVVILGAGFGGLELTASLSGRFGAEIEITLLDRSEHFVFGFSKLDVMFGKRTRAEVSHPYSRINKPGVRFVRATIESIDPATKHVETDAGGFDADYLVVALGADMDTAATPGLTEVGTEYYTNDGAFAVRDVLDGFTGGRVVIGVISTPFKCPPAPSETALLVHEYLTDRGLREASEIAVVMPMPTPVPPLPAASEALLAAFTERGIEWHPDHVITGLDVDARELNFSDGSTMPYDLLLGVPRHVIPPVVAASGLAVDGWVPVDPATLQTSFADVFAIGDVTSIGTPKAGVFAEGQAAVLAEVIAARIGADVTPRDYDGNGVCYVEFGERQAARVDVTFASDQAPFGHFDTASESISSEKDDYRQSRVARWIGAE